MNKSKLFMVMPFSNEIANNNYEHSIKPICEKHNLVIRRADEIFKTSIIYNDIVTEIQNANIIIVDITGKNPNVFYELGIAHTLKQDRTIIITQDNLQRTPLNIGHFRIFHYQNSIVGKANFEKQLKTTLENLLLDGKEIFKDEFQLVFNILLPNDLSDLYLLIGIKKYKGVLKINSQIRHGGRYNKNKAQEGMGIFAKDQFNITKNLKYVKFENDIISLTNKGMAFAEYLIDKRIECCFINDQIFIDREDPFWKKYHLSILYPSKKLKH